MVIERGRKASDLLANDAFTWIVDDQTQYHLAALVAAPPGPSGVDAIAYHHSIQHALSDLVGTLRGYADAGEEMQRVLLDGDAEEDE